MGLATSAAAVLVWTGLGVAYWLAAGGDAGRPVPGQQLWELAERFLLGVMLAAPVIGAFTGWRQQRG